MPIVAIVVICLSSNSFTTVCKSKSLNRLTVLIPREIQNNHFIKMAPSQYHNTHCLFHSQAKGDKQSICSLSHDLSPTAFSGARALEAYGVRGTVVILYEVLHSERQSTRQHMYSLLYTTLYRPPGVAYRCRPSRDASPTPSRVIRFRPKSACCSCPVFGDSFSRFD